MATLSSTRRAPKVALAILLAMATLIVFTVSNSMAANPANKVVAAGATDELVYLQPGGGPETILTAKMKTSKPTDLMLMVAAECEIFTQFSRDGKTSINSAAGTVRIWVEVDGKIVPIQSTSTPPQDPNAQPAGDPLEDSAVFCQRDESYSKTDKDNLCNLETGDMNGCETESWFLRNRTANAFNWVRLNTGSGNHVLEVVAEVDLSSTAQGATDTSNITAAIGNRTFIVEPTKMANDAVISHTGTN